MWDTFVGELVELIKRQWYSPLALVILLFLSMILSLFFFTSVIDIEKLSWTEIIISLVLVVAAFFIWYWTTRCPRPAKGDIGFVVSIDAETKEHHEKIARDFVAALRSLLDEGEAHYKYKLIELSQYHARQVKTQDDANQYLRKCRSHFMIYGRARERELGGKLHHVLNLNGLVKHKPLAKAISRNVTREFSEVMPRGDIKIAHENDLLAFEFTADWMYVIAQYIIGIASFLSGDFPYSQSLFEALQERLGSSPNPIPPIRKIQQRLNTRLSETYGARSDLRYARWQNTRDERHIDEMKEFLDMLERVDPTNYRARLLRALWHFVKNRDVNSAISEIRKCKHENVKDPSWRFSYAFLLAYRGELPQALKQYQIAVWNPYQAAVIMKVESFLLWLADEEPDRIEVHFCLGAVNYFAKEDAVRALEEFETYLAGTDKAEARHREARRRAAYYVSELRHKLGTERLSDQPDH